MSQIQTIAKGLDGIVVDKTALSWVDGENGILTYCGYNIDEIADCSFEEVCYLFLFGELPNAKELANTNEVLKSERAVPEAIFDYVYQAPKTEHPMAVLRTAVSMLSGYLPLVEDLDPKSLKTTALAMIAKVSTIGAAVARSRQGLAPIAPDPKLSHASDFLRMWRGEVPDPVIAKTMNTALILHVDHGFNASTFTARVVASSLSDMVSSVTAAIGSLKGPLHGGANAAVMTMLKEIGDINALEPWVDQALAEKKKIMGFGHRVYKVLDPRAKHLKRMSKEWGERSHDIKWFQMSERLEELMMQKKGLSANVDFYSASTYYAMGIRPDLNTIIFAVARTVGWCAHVIEQLADNRIMRPAALYVGPTGKKRI